MESHDSQPIVSWLKKCNSCHLLTKKPAVHSTYGNFVISPYSKKILAAQILHLSITLCCSVSCSIQFTMVAHQKLLFEIIESLFKVSEEGFGLHMLWNHCCWYVIVYLWYHKCFGILFSDIIAWIEITKKFYWFNSRNALELEARINEVICICCPGIVPGLFFSLEFSFVQKSSLLLLIKI